jgi:hypothetical protein
MVCKEQLNPFGNRIQVDMNPSISVIPTLQDLKKSDLLTISSEFSASAMVTVESS